MSRLRPYVASVTRFTRAGRRRAARSGRRPAVGVATLVMMLVMIPLGGMAALGISVISARRNTVLHATHVKDSLPRIDALIGVREALHNEQTAADSRLRAGGSKLTTAGASVALGLKHPVGPDQAPTATDEALAHYSQTMPPPMGGMTSSTAPIDAAALHQLRAAIAREAIDAATADREYEALDMQAQDSLHSLLDGLASMVGGIDGGYRVWDALQALQAASDGRGPAVRRPAT